MIIYRFTLPPGFGPALPAAPATKPTTDFRRTRHINMVDVAFGSAHFCLGVVSDTVDSIGDYFDEVTPPAAADILGMFLNCGEGDTITAALLFVADLVSMRPGRPELRNSIESSLKRIGTVEADPPRIMREERQILLQIFREALKKFFDAYADRISPAAAADAARLIAADSTFAGLDAAMAATTAV